MLILSPDLDQFCLPLAHEPTFDSNHSTKKEKGNVGTNHLIEFKISLQEDEVYQMKSK